MSNEILKKIKIQKAANEAHVASGAKSTVALSVGLGKSVLAIDRFTETWQNKKNFKGLFTGAREIYSVNFKNELKKFEKDFLEKNLTFICNRSLKNHLDIKYDIIVIDEVHKEPDMTTSFLKEYLEKYPNTEVLGLTGTPLSPNGYAGEEQYKYIPISYRKKLDDAISEDMLNDYNLNVIFHKMNSEDKNVESGRGKAKFKQTELAKYIYLEKSYNKMLSRTKGRFNKFPWEIMNLKLFFKGMKTKSQLTKRLIENVLDYKKLLIYAGTIEQCENLPYPVYHSKLTKTKKEKTYEDYIKGKFTVMSNVGMLKESVTIPDLDTALITSVDASANDLNQKVGRICRLNPEDHANMYLLCAKGTIEEKWLEKSIKLLDFTKITYFSSIDEFEEYYKNKR